MFGEYFMRIEQFIFAENILCAGYELGTLHDKLVCAVARIGTDIARHGENLLTLLDCFFRGDERAARLACFYDDRAV